MKILMTGITGFIGHHLGERLVNDGHEVHAIVRPTSKVHELSENLRGNVKFHVQDSENTVLDIVTDICVDGGGRPDVVFHLATNFITAHRFEDIQKLIQSNITFGTELLDAMAANNVWNFINAGTFEQSIDDNLSPVNLYAATKDCFEGIVNFYSATRGLKCIGLRLSDVYGADDKSQRLLGLMRESFSTSETLHLSHSGQLIDLIYIDDAVESFIAAKKILAACKYDYCGAYSVGMSRPVTLGEVVKIFEEVAGKKLSIKWSGRYISTNFRGTPRFLPNWSPQTSLRDGIKKFLGG